MLGKNSFLMKLNVLEVKCLTNMLKHMYQADKTTKQVENFLFSWSLFTELIWKNTDSGLVGDSGFEPLTSTV